MNINTSRRCSGIVSGYLLYIGGKAPAHHKLLHHIPEDLVAIITGSNSMALKALYHTLSIEICSAFQEERARNTDLARCTAPSTQPQRANTQLCSSKASHNFYHIYPARNTQRLANDQHDSHCDKTVIRLMVSPKMTSSGPTTQEKWDSEIHARRKSSWPKLSWPNQPRTTTWEIARGMTTNVGCSVGRKEEKGEHLKLRTGGLVEGRRR